MRQIIYQTCPSCSGTGDLGKEDCPKCKGSGMKPTGFFFDVKEEKPKPEPKAEVKSDHKDESKKDESKTKKAY